MIQFERPVLLFLGLCLAVALSVLWGRACRIVAGVAAAYGPAQVSASRQNPLRGTLRIAALVAIAFASAGPAWERAAPALSEGVHLVFVLDVSGSMLARDVEPSRLGAAKAALESVRALLDGDEVGLVAAASTPTVVCPPTPDADAFRLLFDQVDERWTTATGTRLASALEEAGRLLERVGAAAGAIVLVSDGEDHGPPLSPVARALRRRGILTHCICVGGTDGVPLYMRDFRGELVPKLDAEGRQVITRARPEVVRRCARDGSGRCWSVSQSSRHLPASRTEIVEGAQVLRRQIGALDLLPHFCILAVLLLACDVVLGFRAARLRG